MMIRNECEKVRRGNTCAHCWKQWENSDWETEGEQPGMQLHDCVECGGTHLRKNMAEKIRGFTCLHCAAALEESLLRKTEPEAIA